MKVYFTASITYREKFDLIYRRIVAKLGQMGHEVNATHVLSHDIQDINRHSDSDRQKDYEEMMEWISEADMMVAEISFPSTVTTGHVVTRALEQGKPVLALYRRGSVPPLLLGLEVERFRLSEYDEQDLEGVIADEVAELVKLPDQRFTMLMPGDIMRHLDELSRKDGNRSEYIRRLIRADMEKKG